MSVRDEVLAYLEAHRGDYVSGQELADRLGISRNSVWKSIEALRGEGYDLESRTNRGYRLTLENDVLSAAGVAAAWPSELAVDCPELHVFAQVDSTNNEAKRMLSSGFEGSALVLADSQSGGRGRRGRTFASPAGGLYMTLVLQARDLVVEPTMCTLAAAVAVAHAIDARSDAHAGIKWVNDVIVDGLKVCGILTEGISDLETGSISSVAVGIGVNLGPAEMPSELRGIAGKVKLAQGSTRNQFAAQVAAELMHAVTAPEGARGLVEEYRRLSIIIGREITYEAPGGTRTALALEIDDAGGLVVRDADGSVTTLRGGEVSVRF